MWRRLVCRSGGHVAKVAANAVSYAISAAQKGSFSWSQLGETTAEGAVEGLAGGALGEDAGGSCTLGGESFTAGTRVLLASGAAVPIAQLKVGDKARAVDTKTGKPEVKTV
jgi:hypothetical protein